MNKVLILFAIGAGIMLAFFVISKFGKKQTLDRVENKTVGQGQHGTARWATEAEIKKRYRRVPFTPALWREGKNLPPNDCQGIIVGCDFTGKKTTALVDTDDVHALMIGAAGVGKTAYFLIPNLEYCCASGMSAVITDTKGDLYKSYARVMERDYGYSVVVLDLRNPMQSSKNNLLHLVNKYMDIWKENPSDLTAKAKAEKYAKIISKTIILSGMDGTSFGQNSYFYDAAEGLLTSVILLVSEFGTGESRHIVSVFKIIQELLGEGNTNNKSRFQELMSMLPREHKARWFAGAAIGAGGNATSSVISTAMSRLNVFLDSELEQMLCFDGAPDAEEFCREKTAIFIVLPEEDNSKHFMASLIIQQLYREILAVADEYGGKLPNRVMFFLDEFGTIPKIESAEMMFSAARSRRLSIVAIVQSFAQLDKNYGKEGAEIITDNTQLTIFGGFAPNSKSAKILSESLGNRTSMSASVSDGKNGNTNYQMFSRKLMTPDELKSVPKGTFIVTKTGFLPMKSEFRLFDKWGIALNDTYSLPNSEARPVTYLGRNSIEVAIHVRYPTNPQDRQELAAGSAKKGKSKKHRPKNEEHLLFNEYCGRECYGPDGSVVKP